MWNLPLDAKFAVWQVFTMTLIEYLTDQQIRPSAFAAVLGVPPSTVHRWLHGIRRPTIGSLIKIEKATDGKIKVSDFFPPPAPPPAQASEAAE